MTKRTHTILIADDDPHSQSVIRSLIPNANTLLAEDTDTAIFKVPQQRIDAFILSADFPGQRTSSLCRRIRAIERYKNTPIIFTTASASDPRVVEILEAGANDFLVRPINPVIAKARIMGHLRQLEALHEIDSVRQNLERYVSPRTQQIVESYSMTGVLPGPKEQKVCVMFTDVRSFTELSQQMESASLFTMLSHHLGMQIDCVYRHGGYIDKFGGDGVMALFDSGDAEAQATQCALEIMQTNQAGNDNAPTLPIGIGIHSGSVLIGNIGSNTHLDYSAIGETVNVAARLCGQAQPMDIIVSEQAMQRASNDRRLAFHAGREITVRGIQQALRVYSVQRKSAKQRRPVPQEPARIDFDRRTAVQASIPIPRPAKIA